MPDYSPQQDPGQDPDAPAVYLPPMQASESPPAASLPGPAPTDGNGNPILAAIPAADPDSDGPDPYNPEGSHHKIPTSLDSGSDSTSNGTPEIPDFTSDPVGYVYGHVVSWLGGGGDLPPRQTPHPRPDLGPWHDP
jgi:hypothetical protein